MRCRVRHESSRLSLSSIGRGIAGWHSIFRMGVSPRSVATRARMLRAPAFPDFVLPFLYPSPALLKALRIHACELHPGASKYLAARFVPRRVSRCNHLCVQPVKSELYNCPCRFCGISAALVCGMRPESDRPCAVCVFPTDDNAADKFAAAAVFDRPAVGGTRRPVRFRFSKRFDEFPDTFRRFPAHSLIEPLGPGSGPDMNNVFFRRIPECTSFREHDFRYGYFT